MEALSKLNFRDLGGIRVCGGAVRRGVLYRSEGPANFEAHHRAELTNIRFRAVCDLRSNDEQKHAPNDWARNARLLNFDIIADLRARNDAAWSLLRANPTAEGARQMMASAYSAITLALIPHLPRFVDTVTAGEIPALIHCTAGKDRTGVLIALLLRLVGASDADIYRDYLLSECFSRKRSNGDLVRTRFEQIIGHAPDEDIMAAILGVDRAYIDAAMETVTVKWGSVESYFAAAGIDDEDRAHLTAALVEPDAGQDYIGRAASDV